MAAAAGDYDEELRRRAALLEAFGDSSESDSDAPREVSPQWRWEAVAGVRGLWLCAAFLSADEQSRLLAAIQEDYCCSLMSLKCGCAHLCFAEGWFSDAHNQAMRFGDLPSWAVKLSALIHEAVCVGDVNVGVGTELSNEDEDTCPLPPDILWRKPLFDQLIANRYKPGHLCSC